MKITNCYEDYSIEELEGLIECPEEIETGCENNCDDCLYEELKLIKKTLKAKKEVKNK